MLADPEELPASVRKAVSETLRERSFRREGDDAQSPLEARIVIVTRGDDKLLGGLPPHEIEVSPLAARREDVLPLAEPMEPAIVQPGETPP